MAVALHLTVIFDRTEGSADMPDPNEGTLEFLARFTQAWNDHDLAMLMAHMDDTCEFMASVGTGVEGTCRAGGEGVRKDFASLCENYPDDHFEAVGQDFILGDRGCCEWIFSGTRKRDGVRVVGRGCDL